MRGKSPIQGAVKKLGQTQTKSLACSDIAKEKGICYIGYHAAITEFLKKTREVKISINTIIL